MLELILLFLCLWCEPQVVEAKETIVDNNTYIICDVKDITETDDGLSVDVIMPNGDIEEYFYPWDMELPEDFDEIVFATANLDDYTTYELKGVR